MNFDHHRIMIVHEAFDQDNSVARVLKNLEAELMQHEISCLMAHEDAESMFLSDAGLSAVLLSWNIAKASELLQKMRKRNPKIPIFLILERTESHHLPNKTLEQASELVWLFEDSVIFIAGRIQAAIERYQHKILGPMAKALLEFNHVHEYSWHTPGHTGGTAFRKFPAGRQFFDYFGENLFRSDLSISVGELGSLLDHSGPIGEGEKYAARVFGADRSYCVTNGTSTSNRVIWTACVTRNEKALVDRNAHKSTEQGLTLTGAKPEYLMPTRNALGIIGPIPPENLKKAGKAAHCVITNSTYDGLCYNVDRVLGLIGNKIDRIHFDEAWYAYARFHPLYQGRFAMRGDPKKKKADSPTLFATHSTHKLLAAFSQASFIHMREGRRNISHERFNESFMMHASTSPFYPIIASNDITCSMMDGSSGEALMDEAIKDAIAFRQMVTKLWREYNQKKSWFFQTWNPLEIGKTPFEKVSTEKLSRDPNCWMLNPDNQWHGFELPKDYCMLDPIKVQVVTTPGQFPATLLTAYLDAKGIEVEKTNDYSILFLFSMGVTNAKWSTLLHHLIRFKENYDANLPLEEVLPTLAQHYPNMGLKDLGVKMQQHIDKTKVLKFQAEAFSQLPKMEMPPADAYQNLVQNKVKRVSLKEAQGKTAATGLVPYPPGIPMIMPGENVGKLTDPFLGYLKALENWDNTFPSFAHDTHGIEIEDGEYRMLVIKQ